MPAPWSATTSRSSANTPDTPPILVDKHKVLQILINLLHNSKYAVDEGAPPEKRMTSASEKQAPASVTISVIDNGIGIPKEHLSRVFEHGFTTRKGGHGFGLHSGALAARELGGALTAIATAPELALHSPWNCPCRPRPDLQITRITSAVVLSRPVSFHRVASTSLCASFTSEPGRPGPAQEFLQFSARITPPPDRPYQAKKCPRPHR